MTNAEEVRSAYSESDWNDICAIRLNQTIILGSYINTVIKYEAKYREEDEPSQVNAEKILDMLENVGLKSLNQALEIGRKFNFKTLERK